jgi:hypothetical protein
MMKKVLLAFVFSASAALSAVGNAGDGVCEPSRLTPALEQLYDSDQASRIGLAPSNDIWNIRRLEEIVAECGWPDSELVGRKAALGAFLVLQHAPLDLQLRYISLLREAAEKGQLVVGTLPLLEDRILVRQGLPQSYGTQFLNGCELHDIADPESVEARREAAGLPSRQEYVAFCFERRSKP